MVQTKNLFVFLLVILHVCSLAYGLNCYACHNDDEFDCAKSPTNKVITCPEGNSCSKTTFAGEITKGCLAIKKPTECKTTENKNGKVESCYCNSDYCNSAVNIKSLQILLIPVIFVPLIASLLS